MEPKLTHKPLKCISMYFQHNQTTLVSYSQRVLRQGGRKYSIRAAHRPPRLGGAAWLLRWIGTALLLLRGCGGNLTRRIRWIVYLSSGTTVTVRLCSGPSNPQFIADFFTTLSYTAFNFPILFHSFLEGKLSAAPRSARLGGYGNPDQLYPPLGHLDQLCKYSKLIEFHKK